MSLDIANGVRINLSKVLTQSNVKANLLSVAALCQQGGTVLFTKHDSVHRDKDGVVVFVAPMVNGLYKLPAKPVSVVGANSAAGVVVGASSVMLGVAKSVKSNQLLHCRLGHISSSGLKKLHSADAVLGLESYKGHGGVGDDLCADCMIGKAHRESFDNHASIRSHAVRTLGRVHADLCGPLPLSRGGSQYMLVIIDEFTRHVSVFCIARKSDAAASIIQWCRQAAVLQGVPIVEFHTDGGGEFLSKELTSFFDKNGINATTTTRHTPQHNVIVERMSRTIMEGVRSMLHHAGASKLLWGEAVMAFVRIRNHTTIRAGTESTCEALWLPRQEKPNVGGMKVWGCDAFIHVPDALRTKLEDKSKSCMFLGYDEKKLAYRVMVVSTMTIYSSRDVRFDEEQFTQSRAFTDGVDSDDHEFNIDEVVDSNELRLVEMISRDEEAARIAAIDQVPIVDPVIVQSPSSSSSSPVSNSIFAPIAVVDPVVNGGGRQPLGVRVGTRIRRPTAKYGMVSDGDIGANSAEVVDDNGDMLSVYSALLTTATVDSVQSDPTTYEEVMACAEPERGYWLAAMTKELSMLDEFKTFEICQLPFGKHAISCKWVFKKKFDSDGKVKQYKARLVAKGHLQRLGENYNLTYAAVLHIKTLRILLSIVCVRDYELWQLDVPSAYLNATLTDEVYMKIPAGMQSSGCGSGGGVGGVVVVRLFKALYGIKQAPREWNAEFNNSIVSLGWIRCVSDSCLYVKKSRTGQMMYLPIFVDDVFPACAKVDSDEMMVDLRQLMTKYKIETIGNADVILGMRVRRDRVKGELTIDQQVYIRQLLTQNGMADCNHVASPEYVGEDESTKDCSLADASFGLESFGSIVGGLLYLTLVARPDMSHAVHKLSQSVSNPQVTDWLAVRRVLRYLKGTTHIGLVYRADRHASDTIVITPSYCDASYGGDRIDRKSTTGWLVSLNGNITNWSSKKQVTICLSSAEAEYMSVASVIQELLWMRMILGEMGEVQTDATVLHCDNQAAMAIASNDVDHSRTKHIDIRHHFVREHIASGAIRLVWVSTNDQSADILTKSLRRVQFITGRDRLVGPSLAHVGVGSMRQ